MLIGGGLLLAGAALGAYALSRRNVPAAIAGLVGAGLLLRAITNTDAKRLVGVGGESRGVDVHKTINIAAPLEEVWSFWSNYENFPLFMHNVRSVIDHGDGRSTWTVAGPAGVPVKWDAVITAWAPGELLAWKSVPGSAVASAGVVRFDRNDYSVPTAYAHHELTVAGGIERIEISSGTELVATHPRDWGAEQTTYDPRH